MDVYGLNLWDDPEQHDIWGEWEELEADEVPTVDLITQLWLEGKLTDEQFDAWLDTVDPGWDESTALTKEELDELR